LLSSSRIVVVEGTFAVVQKRGIMAVRAESDEFVVSLMTTTDGPSGIAGGEVVLETTERESP
jgi:hypothetical protein